MYRITYKEPLNKDSMLVTEYLEELLSKGSLGAQPVELENEFGGTEVLPLHINLESKKWFIATTIDPLKKDQFPMYFDHYVFYPKNTEHADKLSRSPVMLAGPQDFFPGSAAVLSIFKTDDLHLNYLQYCFTQGEIVNRSLASKYMGARHHLLNFALEDAKAEDKKIYLEPDFFKGKHNKKTFDKLAEKKNISRVITPNSCVHELWNFSEISDRPYFQGKRLQRKQTIGREPDYLFAVEVRHRKNKVEKGICEIYPHTTTAIDFNELTIEGSPGAVALINYSITEETLTMEATRKIIDEKGLVARATYWLNQYASNLTFSS